MAYKKFTTCVEPEHYVVDFGTHLLGYASILLMVLRQGLELTVAGSVLGVLGAIALTRVMASLLFGVSATDLPTFTAVPLILVGTALIASYIPALRATRVDPVVALRDE